MNQQADITISKCPKCGGSHTYKLLVKRATALSASGERNHSMPRQFTRLFTCPATNADFQADFAISESADEVIIALQIIGAIIE